MKTHLLSFFEGDDEKILGDLREVAKEFRGKVGNLTMGILTSLLHTFRGYTTKICIN